MGKKKIWIRNVSEDYIRENITSFRWDDICKYKILSQSFMREFADDIYWPALYDNQIFSKDFVREMMRSSLSFYNVLGNNKYDEKFLSEMLDNSNDQDKNFYVYNMCITQNLSEQFMEKYIYYLNWDNVSKYQNLTENFMRKYKHRLSWTAIKERGIKIPKDLEEYIETAIVMETAVYKIM